MVMLVARNFDDLLRQGLTPVPTTSKIVHALTITQPSGTPLSTVTQANDTQSLTKVKMYALVAVRQGISEEVSRLEIEDKDVYCCLVPGTQLGVVAVCEKGYPQGIIIKRMRNLRENLTELKKFEIDEEYGDGY
ncbi:CYFA0S18e01376g1_1 [Cyberlindnera fabianii]|uniref:CYFA0S18e01376g1_1 n=1 Tax=Cyberlindnera fabianii TaxID=36022 RepID=A0A061B632_CYBFA|nr:CYFA0S18e01376g1_1 [Cyberlindnera fabianii]